MVDIKIATSQDELDECLRLRRIVFIEEQDVPEHEEVDGEDCHCTHVLAFKDGKPVGAARFQYIGDKAKIQRVCTLKEMRGTGIGVDLMKGILRIIKAEGKVPVAILGSQTHALDFYKKLGFEICSDEYMDAGIPHKDMQINL